MSGTATLARPLVALLMAGVAPAATEAADARRLVGQDHSAFVDYIGSAKTTALALQDVLSRSATTSSSLVFQDVFTRETTPKEHAIGELRRWKFILSGWDGDQAQAPIPASLEDAITFVRLLADSATAEPMLHATGRAGLFWRENDLYADLEFLGSRRIAYFIERNGDEHKGVVNFDAKEVPAVLEAVLPT